ncbi:MAG: anthranilate synthase component I, partial [Candidatus Methanomethylophilaceae archaeon]
MYRPTLEEARKIAAGGEYRTVPVYREIYSDSRTPIEVLRALLNVSPHCYMLESMEDSQRRGRYTILGFEPTMEFTCVDGTMVIKTEKGV